MKTWKCPTLFILKDQDLNHFIRTYARTCTNGFWGR